MKGLEEGKVEINGFDELMSFMYIDAIGGIIWRTNHDVSHGRYEMTDGMRAELTMMSQLQQYCVQQLSKYGIDPESAKDRPDGDYWKWFHHWNNWKEKLSDEEWQDFDMKMSAKEDYSEFLPKNKWNEGIIE